MSPIFELARKPGDLLDRRPSEVLSITNNKNPGGLPRESTRRRKGTPARPPALWANRGSEDFAPYEGDFGLYPKGFLPWAARALQAAPDSILHACSGRIPKGIGRARVDLRGPLDKGKPREEHVSPDVQADSRSLPFASGVFEAVMIDPPYSVEYAADLYKVPYPRPSHLLQEAIRVTRPGGRIGILHFLVPMTEKGARLERVEGITTGAGYRIRAFTIFLVDQVGLFT